MARRVEMATDYGVHYYKDNHPLDLLIMHGMHVYIVIGYRDACPHTPMYTIIAYMHMYPRHSKPACDHWVMC